jgi:dolichol-phosphate mannosyltransferase
VKDRIVQKNTDVAVSGLGNSCNYIVQDVCGETVSKRSNGSPHIDDPSITVIVPTLNESENIPTLLKRIAASLRVAELDADILVVDGGSTDGTPQVVQMYGGDFPVRLLKTQGRGGLAQDVIQAARVARGEIVAVMDADLSHPPEKLPELLYPVLRSHCDMTIGSRHVPGGSTPDWPWYRKVASRCGAVLSLPFVDVKDPMSGFFAVDRNTLIELGQKAKGFKIGLEILARGGDSLSVREIPIEFRDRQAGETKFGPGQVLEYFQQLGRLSGGRTSTGSTIRWSLVGLLGMGLDLGLFALLRHLGFDVLLSHSVSFLAATILNFILNWKWAFRPDDNTPSYVGYLVTCIMAYILRAGVISQAVDVLHWFPSMAVVLGILSGAFVNYVGSVWFVFQRKESTGAVSVQWRVLAVAVMAYSIAIRLLYGSVMDLIPEEAYYWNYAQHLDYGYLDHPPMVAWLIRLSTMLLGNSELAVRLPAMLCWFGSAVFLWKSTELLFNRTTAFVALALLACLPVFLLTGLYTTPDAFLYMFWIGCVYFIQCAVLLDRRKAWYAVGIFLGLGLLSKYTMGLLGLSLLSFLLFDRRGRTWLRRSEPYLAGLIALVIFSPVILWNAQHGWASFLFQSSHRLFRHSEFGIFILLGAMVLLMSPLGLIGSVRSALPLSWGGVRPRGHKFSHRAKRLTVYLTFIPLTVFVIFSITHSPKLNWAGVVFLAAIPFLAKDICSWNPKAHPLVLWGRRAWRPTLIGLLLLFGFLGFYSISGFPGIAPVSELDAYSPSAWRALSNSVEEIRSRVSRQVGTKAAVVGMDKYFISSELAFHDGVCLADGSPRVAGRGIFPEIFAGDRGLMWRYWVPRTELLGRPVLLISFCRNDLDRPQLEDHFDRMSLIEHQGVSTDVGLITAFYWRVGYDYRNP